MGIEAIHLGEHLAEYDAIYLDLAIRRSLPFAHLTPTCGDREDPRRWHLGRQPRSMKLAAYFDIGLPHMALSPAVIGTSPPLR